jgi:hypothetical protein
MYKNCHIPGIGFARERRTKFLTVSEPNNSTAQIVTEQKIHELPVGLPIGG